MNTRRTLVLAVVVSFIFGCRESQTFGPAPSGSQPSAMMAQPSAAGGAAPAMATAGSPAAAAPAGATDYARAENWLCRPGHNDACEKSLDSTVVTADGTLTPEPFKAATDAPIDCFYVYPTVSNDTTPNSDLVPGPEEFAVVQSQFARFASQCRLFAPMYRQVTLTALRASLAGGMTTGPAPDRVIGYADVAAAWQYYLEHDNNGRGVVLVSHSQGSSVLTQLIKEKLDATPEKRFIGALLIGTNIAVPRDGVVGGTFKSVPLCKTAGELGCIVTYASFRASSPPNETALFARSMDPSMVAGCTNPAALGGGSGELHSYLTASGMVLSSAPTPDWVKPAKPVTTPYVSVPGLLTSECKFAISGSYLAITINADPADPRTDEIVGDVITNGMVQVGWGLHVIDMHLAMGNLVDIVKAKSEAYRARP